jgi:5-methylcytosine-specific restriction endonuclease McrA
MRIQSDDSLIILNKILPLESKMAGIPKSVKELAWNKYIGEKQEGKCYCCKVRTITAFNFEAGHVISKINGGLPIVENLRPICKPCNGSMGHKNLEDFCAEHFPTGTKKTD